MVLGPLSLGASAGDGSGRSNLAQTFYPSAGTARQRAKAEQRRRRRLVKTGIFLLRHERDSVTTLPSGPQNVSSAGFPQPPPPWRLWPGRLLSGGSGRKPVSNRSVIRFGAGARKSLFGNYEGRCFRGKGRMARRDEGEYPWWIFD